MTREEIIDQVKEVLAEEFEVEQDVMTDDAVIKDTLELDSLSLVDLVAVIEHTFKVKIPAADLPTVKTFAQLYDYIESHLTEVDLNVETLSSAMSMSRS